MCIPQSRLSFLPLSSNRDFQPCRRHEAIVSMAGFLSHATRGCDTNHGFSASFRQNVFSRSFSFSSVEKNGDLVLLDPVCPASLLRFLEEKDDS